MSNNQISRTILCGLILTGFFVIFFCATCLSWILKETWDAQIAAAIVSSPMSALALAATRPMLQLVGGYESFARQIAVWIIIFISGCMQYFALGFIVGKIFFGSALKTENKASGEDKESKNK